MDDLAPQGLCFCIMILCLSAVYAQDGPVTPEKFYAVKGSTIELPCVSGTPGERLLWIAEHENDSLRKRSTAYVDRDDPDLYIKAIKDVQETDAGNFACSDGLEVSNLELVVIDTSHPLEMTAQVTSPDEVMVRWKAPSKNPEAVKGYNIYVTEVGGSARETSFKVDRVRPDGMEEYLLEDMSPGTTYEIQVAALYAEGAADLSGTLEGPRSPKIRIDTPNFDAPPGRVKANPWKNDTLMVTWQPPKNVDPRGIDGYIVYYQGISKKNPPEGEVIVDSPHPGNQWRAVLEGLKTRLKYKIQVAAFTGGARRVVGPKSPTVVVRHEGFKPELSIRAIPLGPETVLVTLETIGGSKVDKLRVLYSDDSAVKWDRVKGLDKKETYAIVTGLQPRSRYFFMAKARVDKKARESVTHVMTPPTGLSVPTQVSVSATTDDSVLAKWEYDGRPTLGFIVVAEQELPEGLFRPHKQKVVYKENEALVEDLLEDQRYQLRVIPFDLDGHGLSSEPVHFHIAAADREVDHTTPPPQQTPPYFIDHQPERMEINEGETVRLTCTALGTPSPQVQWFKDGRVIGEPADRVNELTLASVQDSMTLTCRATNSLGSVDRSTRVDVSGEPPRFLQRLPESQVLKQGQDIRLVCSAAGFPVPEVLWYKDGVPLPSARSVLGTAEFYERGVTRSFDLKCEAVNKFGRLEHDLRVLIEDLLLPPVLVGDMPDRIEKYQGEPLSIPCAFTGKPAPTVTWYDRNRPIGQPGVYQNTLQMNSVRASTYLRCRGENEAGHAESIVALIVTPKETSRPDPSETGPSDYSVSIRKIPQSPTEMEVRWAVDKGNLNNLRMFEVAVLSERGDILMRQRLNTDQRSMTLRDLTPGARYIMNLLTWAGNSMVDNSSISLIPTAPEISPYPILHLEVVEIRDDTARVDFTTEGMDPRELSAFRLRVKDIDAGSIGNTIFDRRMPVNSPSINLQRLKPNRHYQVIVDALSRLDLPLLSAAANFRTPHEGGDGTPVSTSSDSQPPPPDSTATPPPPPTTRAPPEPETTTPTRRPPTTTSRRTPPPTTTTEYPEEEENHDYVMTAQTTNKTPYRVDIRWTVDRGPLDGVKSFLVTIKGDRGRILLQEELQDNQRSITIQSLLPNTKYFVNVKANGEDGILVESDLAVQTPSADTVQDTSNPVLDLEANEIRANNARIEWNVVNGEPDLVKSYKLRVLDNGPGGFNLLTKAIPATSQSLNLQRLEPNKRYHVIVDALDDTGNELMTASLTFQTARPNRYGVPVRASSAHTREARQPDRIQQVPEGDTEEPAGPVLNLQIEDLGESSARLTWDVLGAHPGDFNSFKVVVRDNGPDGTELLNNRVPWNSQYFTIDGLYDTGRYYIELQALTPIGDVGVAAGTEFLPGRSPSPLRTSSSQPDERTLDPRQPQRSQRPTDADIPPPELDMELNPSGADQVKVNWSVIGEDSRRPIRSYKIKVHEDDDRGRTLLTKEMPYNAAFFTITSLRPDIHYFIRLDALDSYGSTIQYASTPYLVPPPGHHVEPIRTSSAFNDQPDDKPQSPPQDDSSELIIVEARPEGSNSIFLEWYDVTNPGGKPTRNTMVRYAEFRGNVREQPLIKFVPAPQGSVTVTGLKPDTNYGFQVASVTTGGRFVRWSTLVMKRTGAS